MLGTWLIDDLTRTLDRAACAPVVLWFDKEREYERLLDSGALDGAPFSLLRYEVDEANSIFHGPFWLKMQIEWETRHLSPDERAKRRFVVWLPFSREALDDPNGDVETSLECLLPYRYSGRIWLIDGYPPTLFNFLKSHGVPLPTTQREQRALWEGGRDSRLAKFVARFAGRDGEFWKKPLTPERCDSEMLGGLDEELLPLLADPHAAAKRLDALELTTEFEREVRRKFGFEGDLAADPEAWASAFALRVLMTESFEAFGSPSDFPFHGLVPPENERARHLAFLIRWMDSGEYGEVLEERAATLEKSHDLRAWAGGREGVSNAFPSLAALPWNSFHEELKAVAGSRSEAARFLSESRERIGQQQKSFWTRRSQRIPGWRLAELLANLASLGEKAVEAAAALTKPEQFAEAYVAEWHKLDALYRRLVAELQALSGLDALRSIADLLYTHAIERTNERFHASVDKAPDWAAWGERRASARSASLWKGKGRRAVIVLDALRYDLAADLIAKGDSATIEPWIAEIPAVTPVGMTALLPVGERGIQPTLADGKLELRHESFGDLAVLENRRRLLRSEVPDVAFVDLDAIPGLTEPPKGTGPLVVLGGDIDSIGHGVGMGLLQQLGKLLQSVRVAIRRLEHWGFTEVHVVTDHGFLVLPGGAAKDAGDTAAACLSDKRYRVLSEGAVTQRPIYPWPLDPRQRLVFTEGLKSFTAGQEFLHGGLSLQELVIPHVTFRFERARPTLRIELVATPTEIARNPLELRITVACPPAVDLFDEGPAPRTVEMDLLRVPADRSTSVCRQPKTIELTRDDADRVRGVTLFLDHDKHPVQGEIVHLHLRDIDAPDEDLAPGVSFRLDADI